MKNKKTMMIYLFIELPFPTLEPPKKVQDNFSTILIFPFKFWFTLRPINGYDDEEVTYQKLCILLNINGIINYKWEGNFHIHYQGVMIILKSLVYKLMYFFTGLDPIDKTLYILIGEKK